MNFTDASPLTGARETADGYLIADAFALRTGVQVYLGAEVGRDDLATVAVYRPEVEVFSADSLRSLSHAPVTDDHPTSAVDAANWRTLAKGEVSADVLRDGHRLRIPLIVKDAATVAKVKGGKRQLSAGYTCDLEWADGIAEDGTAYQAIQKNIRFNHLAIVDRARAGDEFRIGDGAATWGIAPIPTADTKGPDMPDNLRTVMVDGLSVSVTDQGAQAIEKLTKDRDTARQALSDAEKKHREEIAAKDAELAKKDAAIDAEKAKVLSDADLDKRVQARADLIAVAGKIAKDVKTAGLSDAAIRKAVVTAKLGDAALAGKSDAYVDARFDILAEEAAKVTDSFKSVIEGGVQPSAPITDSATAYQSMMDRDRNAWRGQATQEA